MSKSSPRSFASDHPPEEGRTRTNNSVLEQAARLTDEHGVPDEMPRVNRLLLKTIDELAIIDHSTPDIDQARRDMMALVEDRRAELEQIYANDPTKTGPTS